MKKLFKLSIVVTTLFLLQSCSSPKSGCTDPNATNFSADADEDCKCCTFKGEVLFWYGKAMAQQFADQDVTALKVFVDGVLKTSAANVYFNSTPDCGGTGTMTTTIDLGGVKNKSYEYQILDQDNNVLVEGIANYTANTCLKIQITP